MEKPQRNIRTAAVYLRKSRMEEGLETEEVLSRHQKTLCDYAVHNGIPIAETYCEVVSGESLYARPQMLRLLEAVSEGRYEAVLVMDLDRLSRGRMKDQGIILDSFRDSGTLIITPDKIYDLSDDIDDELAEFKTFMSRREYKIINKRLRRGLEQSVRDGYYVSNPPYGYQRVFLDRRPSLAPLEEEARFVRMMFQLYLQGHGCTEIARQVNLLGARPHRSSQFSRSSVAAILTNPVYMGQVVFNKKKHIKKGSKGNNKHIVIQNPRENWTIVKGLHPPLISAVQFEQVQAISQGRYIPPKQDGSLRNPLAGLVRCQSCGRAMQRISVKNVDYLLCVEPGCCAGAKLELVEARLLRHLADRLSGIRLEKAQFSHETEPFGQEETLCILRRELTNAERQKTRLYDLLESGEYDLALFRQRMSLLETKIVSLKNAQEQTRSRLSPSSKSKETSSKQKDVSFLEAYLWSDAAHRNALLHAIVDVVWYDKPKKTKPASFTLKIELKPF